MEYSIEIDASKGLVRATGDKAFVESVIEKYNSLMSTKVPLPEAVRATQIQAAPEHFPSAHSGVGTLADYGNVFDVTDGKVSIIADIPGNTQAAKAKNLCLLYLFAKLKLGEDISGNDEVRELCKSHAVYDAANFASHMKGQKKLVVAHGSKGSPNFT